MLYNTTQIDILIIDKQPAIRYGLSQVFEAEPDFNMIDHFESVVIYKDNIKTLSPEIIILDFQFCDNYKSEISLIRSLCPNIKIIIYSILNDDKILNDVIRLGIKGYVVKTSDAQILVQAIRTVANGDYFLDPAISSEIILYINDSEKRHQQKCKLTKRERDILKLIATGYTNKEIANSLFIAESTVKYHVSSIFTKLEVNNRMSATYIGRDLGLV